MLTQTEYYSRKVDLISSGILILKLQKVPTYQP